MTTNGSPSYPRYFSDEILDELKAETGGLNFLIKEPWSFGRFSFDPQIRMNNSLQIYRNGQEVLKLKIQHSKKYGIRMKLEPKNQHPAGLRRICAGADEPQRLWGELLSAYGSLRTISPEFQDLYRRFLEQVNAACKAEGSDEKFWQSRLSCLCRTANSLEWICVDRETGFSFEGVSEEVNARKKELLDQIREDIRAHSNNKVEGAGNGARYIDNLFLNEKGEIVIAELKVPPSDDLHLSPFQAHLYQRILHEWSSSLLKDIKKAILQRVELGMLPPSCRSIEKSDVSIGQPCLVIVGKDASGMDSGKNPLNKKKTEQLLSVLNWRNGIYRLPVYVVSDPKNPRLECWEP